MSKIDLNNISHSYNPNDPNPIYALNPFSMTWENGKRYAILGPSGCGKTTMLNIVSGLVRPSKGSILFDDKDITNLKDNNFNLGIRASDIELNEKGFEFEVELAEISGSETLLHLTRGDTKLITSIEEVMNFNIHDKVKINFNITRIYAFNENEILASSPFGGSYV